MKKQGRIPYLPSYDGVDINSENTTVAPTLFLHCCPVEFSVHPCPPSFRFMELAGIYMKRLLITPGE